MPGGLADVLDVGRAHALLHADRAVVRRRLLAEEVGLEGHHAGVDEQQVGVVEQQRGRRHRPVYLALLEVRDEPSADLRGVHQSLPSLGRGRRRSAVRGRVGPLVKSLLVPHGARGRGGSASRFPSPPSRPAPRRRNRCSPTREAGEPVRETLGGEHLGGPPGPGQAVDPGPRPGDEPERPAHAAVPGACERSEQTPGVLMQRPRRGPASAGAAWPPSGPGGAACAPGGPRGASRRRSGCGSPRTAPAAPVAERGTRHQGLAQGDRGELPAWSSCCGAGPTGSGASRYAGAAGRGDHELLVGRRWSAATRGRGGTARRAGAAPSRAPREEAASSSREPAARACRRRHQDTRHHDGDRDAPRRGRRPATRARNPWSPTLPRGRRRAAVPSDQLGAPAASAPRRAASAPSVVGW